jgi:hypothetical protein
MRGELGAAARQPAEHPERLRRRGVVGVANAAVNAIPETETLSVDDDPAKGRIFHDVDSFCPLFGGFVKPQLAGVAISKA